MNTSTNQLSTARQKSRTKRGKRASSAVVTATSLGNPSRLGSYRGSEDQKSSRTRQTMPRGISPQGCVPATHSDEWSVDRMGIVQPNKQAIPGQGKGTEKAMRSRQPHRLTGYFHRADWPFYWIAQVSTTYTQELEMVLKTLGCEVPTWRVLVILQEHRTSSISEVATQAVAKLSTTTKIVYRMKAEGLVQTTPCPKDGRVTLVQLTSNGMQLLGRISDATHGLFEQSFRGLTPLKIKRLNELLKHVLINLIGEHHPLLKTAHPASTGTA